MAPMACMSLLYMGLPLTLPLVSTLAKASIPPSG